MYPDASPITTLQSLGVGDQSIMAQDDALYATFKVSATSRGNDALIEASEDLRSGLSVGVEVLDSKQVGNTLEIISARLEEVSLVSNPAFKSAEVLEVAASEVDAVEENNNYGKFRIRQQGRKCN